MKDKYGKVRCNYCGQYMKSDLFGMRNVCFKCAPKTYVIIRKIAEDSKQL